MNSDDLLGGLLDMGHFQARHEAQRQMDEEAGLVHALKAQLRHAQRKSDRYRHLAMKQRKGSSRNDVQDPKKGKRAQPESPL